MGPFAKASEVYAGITGAWELDSKIQICAPQARPAKAPKWASSLKMLNEYEQIIF